MEELLPICIHKTEDIRIYNIKHEWKKETNDQDNE